MVAGHSWGAWELGFLRLLHRENFGSGLTSTIRTAGCGPACPVMWQGISGRSADPYADVSRAVSKNSQTKCVTAPWKTCFSTTGGAAGGFYSVLGDHWHVRC
jgi:hypothetical protein